MNRRIPAHHRPIIGLCYLGGIDIKGTDGNTVHWIGGARDSHWKCTAGDPAHYPWDKHCPQSNANRIGCTVRSDRNLLRDVSVTRENKRVNRRGSRNFKKRRLFKTRIVCNEGFSPRHRSLHSDHVDIISAGNTDVNDLRCKSFVYFMEIDKIPDYHIKKNGEKKRGNNSGVYNTTIIFSTKNK
jgi:hypothetical protein